MVTKKQMTASDYEWMAALLRDTEQKIQERFMAESVYLDVRMESPNKTPLEVMLHIVAKSQCLQYRDYTNGCRHKEYVAMRQIASQLGKRILRCSLNEIARAIGAKDHSSILYNVNKCDERLLANENYFCERYQMAEAAVVKWKISQTSEVANG